MAAWFRLVNVNQFEESLTFSEYVWVALLADFTFKFLPVVGSNIFAIFFYMSLRFQPALQAVVVDVADSTGALAGQN